MSGPPVGGCRLMDAYRSSPVMRLTKRREFRRRRSSSGFSMRIAQMSGHVRLRISAHSWRTPGELVPMLAFALEVFVRAFEPARVFVNLLDDEPARVERAGVDVWVADPAVLRAHAHLFERWPVVAAWGFGVGVAHCEILPYVWSGRWPRILPCPAASLRLAS